MLTGRLAFSTHKQQIYCILCHGQNQFSVSVSVAVTVWSCLSAYVAYQLRSVSASASGLVFGLGSALARGPGSGSGSGWGSRIRFAEPAPKIASDCESMMLLLLLMLVKMMSMSQCRWHLSPRRKQETSDRQREERVQLELLLLLLLLIRQLLLLTKNQFNWINFVEFPSDAAALSVHIRFSTLFPCHFRAQILFEQCRELSSFILRQEFAQFIILFFSIFMGFLFCKNFLGMHKSNCKWWISIAFAIFILDFFCSARDEIFTSVWNEVREKRVPEQRRQHVYLARSFIHN